MNVAETETSAAPEEIETDSAGQDAVTAEPGEQTEPTIKVACGKCDASGACTETLPVTLVDTSGETPAQHTYDVPLSLMNAILGMGEEMAVQRARREHRTGHVLSELAILRLLDRIYR